MEFIKCLVRNTSIFPLYTYTQYTSSLRTNRFRGPFVLFNGPENYSGYIRNVL